MQRALVPSLLHSDDVSASTFNLSSLMDMMNVLGMICCGLLLLSADLQIYCSIIAPHVPCSVFPCLPNLYYFLQAGGAVWCSEIPPTLQTHPFLLNSRPFYKTLRTHHKPFYSSSSSSKTLKTVKVRQLSPFLYLYRPIEFTPLTAVITTRQSSPFHSNLRPHPPKL